MEIIIEKPDYLWLLLILPVIVIAHMITLKFTKRKAIRFANFEIIERITGGESLSKNFFLLVIRVIILLLFVLALSGTTISYTGLGSNFDFSIVIDASNSMLVQDMQPNRLEAAKENAINFVNNLNNNNHISVISFSSTALLETSLTNNLEDVKAAISRISAKETGGTNIGDTLITAVNSLLNSENSKVIILLTDGRSNTGVSISDAVEYAKIKQVVINTIGIGTEEGGEYIAGVNLTLDEATLRYIASETGGKYFRAPSTESLAQAYNEILATRETTIFRNLSLPFTIIALVLLLIEWILFNTKYRTIP